LAQKARDEGITGVIGQVLNIPVTCHPKLFPKDKYVYKSYYGFTTTSVLNTDKMDWFWNLYLPGGEYEVYASPLLAKSLNELPPACKLSLKYCGA
jgi:acetyl esterase/lipase